MKSIPLPDEEVRLLRSLLERPSALHVRVRDLHHAGWTLQAIGNAFSPPRRRSTVLSWVNRPSASATLMGYPPVPRPSAAPLARSHRRAYLSASQTAELADLSVLARLYRARTSETSPAALANTRLTELVVAHFQRGVRVADLARAANVTHRAITRRLEKALLSEDPA